MGELRRAITILVQHNLLGRDYEEVLAEIDEEEGHLRFAAERYRKLKQYHRAAEVYMRHARSYSYAYEKAADCFLQANELSSFAHAWALFWRSRKSLDRKAYHILCQKGLIQDFIAEAKEVDPEMLAYEIQSLDGYEYAAKIWLYLADHSEPEKQHESLTKARWALESAESAPRADLLASLYVRLERSRRKAGLGADISIKQLQWLCEEGLAVNFLRQTVDFGPKFVRQYTDDLFHLSWQTLEDESEALTRKGLSQAAEGLEYLLSYARNQDLPLGPLADHANEITRRIRGDS